MLGKHRASIIAPVVLQDWPEPGSYGATDETEPGSGLVLAKLEEIPLATAIRICQ
jgi:hypothetical protein